MRKLILFLLMILSVNLLNATGYTPLSKEQTVGIVQSDTRYVVSLAGAWKQSFDGETWENKDLPASVDYDGTIIYERPVKIDTDLLQNRSWHLFFTGIDHQVEVYFNDQFVGRYIGTMSPFKVRIPDRMLGKTTNNIKLKISPAEYAAKQVKEQFLDAKKVYTGMLRELLLIGTPKIWTDNVHYKIKYAKNEAIINANVNISASKFENILNDRRFVDSSSAPVAEATKTKVSVHLALVDIAKGDTVLTTAKQQFEIERERTVESKFKFSYSSPVLWSPENPYLYSLVAVLTKNGGVIDSYAVDLGFRSISGGKNKLLLNGAPISIKGVNYIEDIAKSASTVSPNQMEADIKNIKTLGANTILFKFCPPHPYMLSLCNKYGLMALVDLPMYDVPSSLVGATEIRVDMENKAKQYVNIYDQNPSVIAWGLSDGIREGVKESKEYETKVSKIFRTSSDKLLYKIVMLGADTLNTANVDFIGFKDSKQNISVQESDKYLTEMINYLESKPAFLTFGTYIQPKNHNGYSDQLSIEYQAHYIRNMFYLNKNHKLSGTIINAYNDYALQNPLLIADNDNQYLGTLGLVDNDRQTRLSYELVQSLYNKEKEPLLAEGSFSPQTPVSFLIIGLILGVLLIVLINRFRRFREYLFRSLLRPYNFYADLRDQRIMSSIQTILLSVIISITIGIYFASILYFYRTNELAQYVLMFLIPSESLKEIFYRLSWTPIPLMLFISVIAFIKLFIISAIIRVFAFFMRARIFFSDAFTIAIWSGVPLLVLLPISAILIRILVVSPDLIIALLLIFALMMLWFIGRVLRASSVIFDKVGLKVYTAGLILLVILVGFPLGFYEYNMSIFAFAEYFFNVLL